MGWNIECSNSECGHETWAANIVDLRRDNCDSAGWFLCGACGSRGNIPKEFRLQEPGQVWAPFLKGMLRPRNHDAADTYQPFAFLVGYEKDGPAGDVWFSYYKDMRPDGLLKMGYGPGGPPVFAANEVLDMVAQMVDQGLLSREAVAEAIQAKR